MKYDLLVIGAGAAGLGAARAGRRRGASVAVVADGPIGGECTFVGCVPSKTLIEAARAGETFEAAMKRVRSTVDEVAATESATVLRAEGIDVIEGRARLAGPGRVDVDGRAVAYHRLVLATGTTPAVPPIPGLDEARVLTNQNVFELGGRPASLLVLGGGPIGVELGQAFARLGTEVTVIEGDRRLLPREEPEASALLSEALAADGVRVHTGSKVLSAEHTATGTRLALEDGSSVHGERILVAAGRRPRSGDLGLDEHGVATDGRGFIVTDRHLRTNVAAVYAAGDVTGRPAFTHAADEMGRLAANNALGRLAYRTFSEAALPAVTFTDPEVARVGVTEDTAAATVRGARVAYLPLAQVDRAVTAGRTDGYVKLIAGPRRLTGGLAGGRLVGATVVAAHAGEMIAVPTLMMRTGMTPARVALTVQAYPTWTLGIRQAAAQFFVESAGRRWRPARPTGR
ncbi:MAG: FAD-dependent oxidoreductase [Acidobacteriota bacterium]|nr:FAD-dependent oxidoreductase [Acidobacteriota bacterium]